MSGEYKIPNGHAAIGAKNNTVTIGDTLLVKGSAKTATTFADDGAQKLYYNASLKFATTTSGIDIMGSVVTYKLGLLILPPGSPGAGDNPVTQGIPAASDTLFVNVNSNWQKFAGTVNNL